MNRPPKDIRNSKVRCPKCKSNNLQLIEIWEGHTISWEQEDGKFDLNNGAQEPGGPYKVQGRCRGCDHWWTIKGIRQIHYVIPEEGGEQKEE